MENDTSRNEKKHLETLLLEFIEKTINEPSLEKNIEILPMMVHELIELWKI